MSDLINYHKTINKEICLLKDKLKYLTKHNLANGNYREIILLNALKKHLPIKYSVGTGFIVKQCENRGEHETSTQVDLIVYDNSYPLLFREGDFAIITTDAVRAIIEVKTRFSATSFRNAYSKANDMGAFVLKNRDFESNPTPFFNGIFFFNNSEISGSENSIEDIIKDKHNNTPTNDKFELSCVNHICLSDKVFYKYWHSNDDGSKNKLYLLEDLAYSFFISNLLSYLEGHTMKDNTYIWYPHDKTFSCYRQF
jgi:hypothetical protein